MSKDFITISREECLSVSVDCIANSNAKYNEAIKLAEFGSYGSASSSLIISSEELIKGLILHMDGVGFQFRKINGIKSLFEHHKLRYYLIFVLSVMRLIMRDFQWFMIKIYRTKKVDWIYDLIQDKNFEMELGYWIKKRLSIIKEEVDWISKTEIFRQDGMYVGFKNELHTPLDITLNNYKALKKRVDILTAFTKYFIHSLHPSPINKMLLKHTQKQFIKDDYYKKIGEVVKKLNSDRNKVIPKNLLKKIEEALENFEDVLEQQGKRDIL